MRFGIPLELLDKNFAENARHFKSGRRCGVGAVVAAAGWEWVGLGVREGRVACKGDLQMMKGGP